MVVNKTRKAGDYVVAIPSYKRATTLTEKTLTTLKGYRIPASKIYIFVADKEEEDVYRNTVPKDLYFKIVVGIKGIKEVRNFITGYFPVGKHIVCMDDDVKGFLEYDEKEKRHEKPLVSLEKVIKKGFEECKKAGARLWGVYPIANGFFMKPSVTEDLKFIVGVFFGIINPGLAKLKIPVDMKTDYYITLRMYELDERVIRINSVAPKTAYYKEAGGIQAEEGRHKKSKDAAEMLIKLYPDWVKLNPNRKSGFVEIRLKDSTKHT
jgi:hypothetical protein